MTGTNSVELVECPRDAMQGLHHYIPAEMKVEYLNQLLRAGFNTLDFGSFVSPKAIPQLRDTAEVLAKLDRGASSTSLLAIVANERGAKEALSFSEIDFLGFQHKCALQWHVHAIEADLAKAAKLPQKLLGVATPLNPDH